MERFKQDPSSDLPLGLVAERHDRQGDSDESTRSDPQSEHLHAPEEAPLPAEVAVAESHAMFGNELVAAALSGESAEGLGPVIAGSIVSGLGGLQAEGSGNQAMLRRMASLKDSVNPTQVLNRLPASGQRLPEEHRRRFEQAFEKDLSDVQVHADGAAAQAAKDLQAHAFALGKDIYFGAGKYRPGTKAGDRLLAHELTHVVQYKEGRLPLGKGDGAEVSDPSDPAEREAYANESIIVDKLSSVDSADSQPVETQAPDVAVDVQPLGSVSGPTSSDVNHDGQETLDEAGAFEEGVELDGPASTPGEAGLVYRDETDDDDQPMRQAIADLLAQYHDTRLPDAIKARISSALGQDISSVSWSDGTIQAALGIDASKATPLDAIWHGNVLDSDEQRAQQTQQLMTSLIKALKLPAGSLRVFTDADAGAKTTALGTRGVMEGGDLYLNPDTFDPGTVDGRQLLAHEMIHVAQDALDLSETQRRGDVSAGALAEAEAHMGAEQFAASGTISSVEMGIPSGHVAAEGAPDGSALTAMVEGQKAKSTEAGAGLNAGEAPNSSAKEGGEQNREKKISQYEDGVSGIGGLIGDLSAFDDLCEAIDDDEPTSGHLSRVKSSNHYKRLCEMWQGAIEGEEDSSRLKSIFNDEFDGKGFWAETEKAFEMVCAGAKRDAKPDPAASKAKADLAKGEAEKGKLEGEGEGGKGKGAGGGPGAGPGGKGAVGDPVKTAGGGGPMSAGPTGLADDIPGYAAMLKSSVFDHKIISASLQNYKEMSAAGYDKSDRLSEVAETTFKSFTGKFAESFTDSMIDTLVIDQLAGLADKKIGAKLGEFAAKKGMGSGAALKAPMIGPLIGLAKNPPWTAEAWGLGNSDELFKSGAAGLENWSKMDTVEFGSTDYFGYMCASIGDFLTAIGDIIGRVSAVVGTLSALAFIVGGILLIAGLCLLWCGVGLPMVNAGGWLINAGGRLANLASLLGKIEFVVSALAAVFTVAGALMVPSEAYAKQLDKTGEAAGKFGEKSGAKVADWSGDKIKDAASKPADAESSKHGDESPEDGADGKKFAEDGDKAIADEQAKLKDAGDEVIDTEQKLKDLESAGDDGDAPDGKKQGDDGGEVDAAENKKSGDDTDAPDDRSMKQKFLDGAQKVGNWINNLDGAAAGLQQIGFDANSLDQGSANINGGMIKKWEVELKKMQDEAINVELSPKDQKRALDAAQDLQKKITAAEEVIKSGRAKQVADQNEKYNENFKENQDDAAERLKLGQQEKLKKEEKEEHERAIEETEEKLKAKETELEEAKKAKKDAEDSEAKRASESEEEANQAATQRNQSALEEANQLDRQATAAADVQRIDAEIEALRREASGRQWDDPDLTSDQAWEVFQGDASDNMKRDYSRDAFNKKYNEGERFNPTTRRWGKPHGRNHVAESDSQGRMEALETNRQNAKGDFSEDELAMDPNTLRQQARSKREEGSETDTQGDQSSDSSSGSANDGKIEALQQEIKEIEEDLKFQKDRPRDRSWLDIRWNEGDVQKGTQGKIDAGLGQTDRGFLGIGKGSSSGGLKGETKWGKWDKDGSPTASGVAADLLQPEKMLGGITMGLIAYFSDNETLEGQAEYYMKESKGKSPIPTVGKIVNKEIFQDYIGLKPVTKEAHKKLQAKEIAIKEALAHKPPEGGWDAMMTEHTAASAAYCRYRTAHTESKATETGAQALNNMAVDTLDLAASGKPVEQDAQNQAGPIAQSKTDEATRKSTLAGGNDNVQQPDGAMASLVSMLVSKIAANSDNVSGSPDTGGADGGAQVNEVQGKAATESTDKKKQAIAGSDEQSAFLDAAEGARKGIESNVADTIGAVEEKAAHEKNMAQDLTSKKDAAIARRNTAKGQVETHVNEYNAKREEMLAWSKSFEEKRGKTLS